MKQFLQINTTEDIETLLETAVKKPSDELDEENKV